MISPEKWLVLKEKMLALQINESDLQEKFILGSGSGGQKINKTSSCVWLKHLPSNIIIKCQESRSQEDNRYYARRRLCEKIEMQILNEKSKIKKEQEKIRRQKRKRSKRAKEKILKNKAQRSITKQRRQTPADNDNL